MTNLLKPLVLVCCVAIAGGGCQPAVTTGTLDGPPGAAGAAIAVLARHGVRFIEEAPAVGDDAIPAGCFSAYVFGHELATDERIAAYVLLQKVGGEWIVRRLVIDGKEIAL